MSEKYNGWTNYATWKINLEVISDYADSLLRDNVSFPTFTDMVDHFREYTMDVITEHGALDSSEHYAVDLALSFLRDVDWEDIGNAYVDGFLDEDEDEEEDEDE